MTKARLFEAWGEQPLRYLYRGQGDAEWRLQSELERYRAQSGLPADGAGIYAIATDLFLGGFKRMAAPILGRQSDSFSDAEWWSIGRHHGLFTPLLDWSASPYVAAFFAYAQAAERDAPGFLVGKPNGTVLAHSGDRNVAVWRLRISADLFVEDEFERIEATPFDNPRQRAQQGVLTLLMNLQLGDLTEYLREKGHANALTKFVIPYSGMAVAMHDLQLMNIRFSTLFPDLTGAAIDANLSNRFSVIEYPYKAYGSGLQAGDSVAAHANETIVGSTTADASGNWSIDIQPQEVQNGTSISFRVNGFERGPTVTFQSGQFPAPPGITL